MKAINLKKLFIEVIKKCENLFQNHLKLKLKLKIKVDH